MCPSNFENWPKRNFLFWVSLWAHGCLYFSYFPIIAVTICVYAQIVSSLANRNPFGCLWFPIDLPAVVLLTFLLSHLTRHPIFSLCTVSCARSGTSHFSDFCFFFFLSGKWCSESTVWRLGCSLLLGYHCF